MKIREVLDKKVGGTEYTRYITTLPKIVASKKGKTSFIQQRKNSQHFYTTLYNKG